MTDDDDHRVLWTIFAAGAWVREIPTAPGVYLLHFGGVMQVEVHEVDGALVAYHHALGQRAVEGLFANRWRWSVPLPHLPPVPGGGG